MSGILSFTPAAIEPLLHLLDGLGDIFRDLWHDVRGELLPKVIAEVFVAVTGFFVIRFEEKIKEHWGKITVHIRQFFSRRRIVLLWIDSDAPTLHRVASRLQACSPYLRIVTLSAPASFLHYPARPSVVAAVILISTDVTKLSSDDRVREEIEVALEKYVLRGGGLIAAHDIIYRRTRNHQLSAAFGGTIRQWHAKDAPIRYEKSPAQANHPIARRLPDAFELDDLELLEIEWTVGSDVLFHEAGSEPPRSLVVARDYGRGRLVWLNSGDHGLAALAPSIAAPSPNFVSLLNASAHWASRQPQLALGAPLIAAHRGVQQFGGENTMRAYRTAIDFRANYIECDIRRTQDGVLVLHHDPAIGNAAIAQTTFADLAPIAHDAGRPLARLEELLEAARNQIGLDLELKETGYEADIAAMLQAHQLDPASFVVTSFLDIALQRFKECYPAARCGLLLEYKRWPGNRFPIRRLRSLRADFIAPNHRLVTRGFARRMQRANFPLWVWTVNDQLRVAELLRTPGVEAVITDFVTTAQQQQSQLQEE
jgi:glycerophosphoryl diester phosphodiesterase